jgi:trans-2,3-dihydro-3-hydroxyanthranilate isomerase
MGPTLHYDVVDVFADRAFAGNQLAVVSGGDALSTEQMQAIATEFGLSETAFPLEPIEVDADYRLRIFTPDTELVFAGLPSIGTAWLMGANGELMQGHTVQETAAGLHSVIINTDSATLIGGEAQLGEHLDAAPLARVLGLDPSDVDGHASPGVAGVGMDFTFLPVRADALARVVPQPDLAEQALGRGLVAVAFQASRNVAKNVAKVRMFRASGGEDAATGTAALALAVWLVDRGLLPPDGEFLVEVHQGEEIARPSTLVVTMHAVGGRVAGVEVSGRVVHVATGKIRIPFR